MKILASRASVAAGDDVEAPHMREFIFKEGTSLINALEHIRRDYLPRIAGGEATWSVCSNVPVAIIAQQWNEPKMMLFPSDNYKVLDMEDGFLKIHFNYHAQVDPNVVLKIFFGFRLKVR